MSLETGPTSNSTTVGSVDCSNADMILAVADRLASRSVFSGSDIDIAAKTTHFGRARGDFYWYQSTAYGSFMIVGDVGASGECPEAAMQLLPSAIAQAASDNREPDPLALLSAVASVLYRDLVDHDAAATLCVATWDASETNLVVSNAGHFPLLHASGSGVRQLESSDAPIGTWKRLEGVPEVISLSPGDFLLMGTDGLIEQEDKAGMEFGFPRLAQTLLDDRGLAASDVIDDVFNAISAYGRGVRQLDDRTALVITRPVVG